VIVGKRALELGFIVVAVMAVAQNVSRPKKQIRYHPAAGADQKKTLPLKDFHPASMLDALANRADRARFCVIDVHNHVNDAQGIGEPMPPERGHPDHGQH
jgi:hypothetical protein